MFFLAMERIKLDRGIQTNTSKQGLSRVGAVSSCPAKHRFLALSF